MKAEAAMLIGFILLATILWWKIILPLIWPFIAITLAFFFIRDLAIPFLSFLFGNILVPIALFLLKAVLVLIVIAITFFLLAHLYVKFTAKKPT
ncbi:small-conductance mechanosensitive channel [Bacillus ectoiniformans]|uniref:hypothetical protein n=1 Tax=Bacillus ectoiniformans TaxID=1494429 RepID=UPI00195B9E80|nr:hypothetical protein [Bacillus ectoiniformans]MBM7648181.1 small-conductance mechanosensitive channel [Bacillus ectoiniformans]